MRYLLLLLLVAPAAAAPPTPFPIVTEGGTRPPAYLVRIFNADEEGNRSLGTGTLVSSDTVITAAHVVDGKVGVKIEVMFFTDWSVAIGEVVDISVNEGYEEGDTGHDVAVIHLLGKRKEKPLPVAGKAIKGEVMIEGYAHGPYLSATGNYYTPDTSGRWGVIRDAQARNGDSGGPVIQNGKLVGVLWGSATGHTWFTPIETIIKLFPELIEVSDAAAGPRYSLR